LLSDKKVSRILEAAKSATTLAEEFLLIDPAPEQFRSPDLAIPFVPAALIRVNSP
jgi:hypothetical protein